MKFTIVSTTILVFLTATFLVAAEPLGYKIDEDIPERGIYSLRSAQRWEEGLLIGNGRMGGVIHGKLGDWTLSLTHERIGIPDHEAGPPPDLTGILPEIRRLVRSPERWRAASLAWDTTKKLSKINNMIWTDPFVNAANLRISLDGENIPKTYRRSLDYTTGLAKIQWTADDTLFVKRSFISRADNVMVLQLATRGDKKLSGSVQLTQGGHGFYRRLKDIQPPTAEGQWLSCRFGFTLNDGGYEVLARVITDGKHSAEKDAIRFDKAKALTVFLRIQPLKDYGASQLGSIKKELTGFAGQDFDKMFARHVKIHGGIYNRVSLDLGGDQSQRAMPAEELWELTHKKEMTPALLERVFYSGRYQILSSTGNWPPNLQGIWAGAGNSPWRGDYTQNGNVPAAIGNMLNGNMPELLLAYTGYLESLMDHHRANARQLYGARGIMLSSRTSLDGYAQHYNHRYPHAFWVAGAAWAGGFFYDYYLHTGDKEFLTKHALPWMKEAALFFEDFLVEDNNGMYEFIPGYSPEVGGAAMNTTMDVAAARQLLRNLISACNELGIEKANVAKWETMLTKMPKYRIAEGRLAEWIDPRMRDKLGHRHCSHFLPLWFGLDPEIAGDPKLLAAARKAVRDKAEARCRDKVRGVMSFGTAHIGWAAASLGDGKTVDKILDNLSTVYYYPNFASSCNASPNGPAIFNVDISGGLPALMIEMLVQSRPGEITLLSARPESLPHGTLKGALCRGQVTIEELKWSPNNVKVRLRSPKAQELKLRVIIGEELKETTLSLSPGKSVAYAFDKR